MYLHMQISTLHEHNLCLVLGRTSRDRPVFCTRLVMPCTWMHSSRKYSTSTCSWLRFYICYTWNKNKIRPVLTTHPRRSCSYGTSNRRRFYIGAHGCFKEVGIVDWTALIGKKYLKSKYLTLTRQQQNEPHNFCQTTWSHTHTCTYFLSECKEKWT